MHFRIPHCGKEAAKPVVDSLMSDLIKKIPQGVQIQNAIKKWQEDVMHFAFDIKKGWLINFKISGNVIVKENEAIFSLQMPALASSFISEDQIHKMISEKLS